MEKCTSINMFAHSLAVNKQLFSITGDAKPIIYLHSCATSQKLGNTLLINVEIKIWKTGFLWIKFQKLGKKVDFPGAQWVNITKCYATVYCRPQSSFLKSESHFSVTALTDAAGNPEADMFSLKGTSESQLLALCEPNTVQRTTGSYYAITNSLNRFWLWKQIQTPLFEHKTKYTAD